MTKVSQAAGRGRKQTGTRPCLQLSVLSANPGTAWCMRRMPAARELLPFAPNPHPPGGLSTAPQRPLRDHPTHLSTMP